MRKLPWVKDVTIDSRAKQATIRADQGKFDRRAVADALKSVDLGLKQ